MKKILNKIWLAIKIFVAWLVYSSENAEKISLMVKGIALGVLPTVLILLNAFNVQTSSETLTKIIDTVSSTIILVGGIVSALTIVWGALRKIWSTLTGTNDVIASYGGYDDKY